MSWNYRVIKEYDKQFDHPRYTIKEVYYGVEDDGSLRPNSWSSNDMSAYGETLHELINDLRLMNEAFSKPVLELKVNEYGQWTLIELENE